MQREAAYHNLPGIRLHLHQQALLQSQSPARRQVLLLLVPLNRLLRLRQRQVPPYLFSVEVTKHSWWDLDRRCAICSWCQRFESVGWTDALEDSGDLVILKGGLMIEGFDNHINVISA